MKLTSIEYRETRTFGDYQNVVVGLTAAVDVESGENVTDGVGVLKAAVQRELAKRVAESEAVSEARAAEFEERKVIRNKSRDLQTLEDNIATARSQWAKCEDFMARHGVKIDEELPF